MDSADQNQSPGSDETIMDAEQIEQSHSANAPSASDQQASLTPDQLRDLADPRKQDQYRLAYHLQQARRFCPGCGDDGVVY
jgi:hypothetical protein